MENERLKKQLEFCREIDKEKYPKAEQDYRFVKNA